MSVGEPFSTSDHQIIRFDLVVVKELAKDDSVAYNYFKADYIKMRNYAKLSNWESLVDPKDVDKSWLALKSELLNLRNKFVPKTKRNKNKCKWVNGECWI